MGLFEQLAGALGGQQQARQQAERWEQGQGNFENPQSPDFQSWNELVGAAPPRVLRDSLTEAARRTPPQEYHDHITPGIGGTDPLGGLASGALPGIAGALLSALTGSRGARDQMGGGGLDTLTQLIPGLRTTDPNRMTPEEVAALSRYTQQNHPDAFGRAATQVGRQDPGLLQQLLGNKALMMGAAALAAKVLSDRSRRARAA